MMLVILGLGLAAAAAPLAAATAPAIGTFLEPWYTARAPYHWAFPAEVLHSSSRTSSTASMRSTSASDCARAVLLFADVNGDGLDDNIRAGCGRAGDGWVVSGEKLRKSSDLFRGFT